MTAPVKPQLRQITSCRAGFGKHAQLVQVKPFVGAVLESTAIRFVGFTGVGAVVDHRTLPQPVGLELFEELKTKDLALYWQALQVYV